VRFKVARPKDSFCDIIGMLCILIIVQTPEHACKSVGALCKSNTSVISFDLWEQKVTRKAMVKKLLLYGFLFIVGYIQI